MATLWRGNVFFLRNTDMSSSLGRSERWSQAAPGVPHCKHSHLFTAGEIVDVIACSFEQDTTRIRYRRLPIGPPDMWRVAEQIKSCREFGGEQVGRGSAILAPPLVRIWASASGVVRTGRLTAGGAALSEFHQQAGDYLLRRISRTPRALRARHSVLRW